MRSFRKSLGTAEKKEPPATALSAVPFAGLVPTFSVFPIFPQEMFT